MTEPARCSWAGDDALMRSYHDREWGVPIRDARLKIEAAIRAARIYLEMQRSGERFTDFCWSFTEGKVIVGNGRSRLTASPLSERISTELKRRGFGFVGPTIVHAWLQAVGILNDHALTCFRRAPLRER